MTTTEKELLEAINRDEGTDVRLIYADWLEDNGRLVESKGWRVLRQHPYTDGRDYHWAHHVDNAPAWNAAINILPQDVFDNTKGYTRKTETLVHYDSWEKAMQSAAISYGEILCQ